jgi:hypothetical protein
MKQNIIEDKSSKEKSKKGGTLLCAKKNTKKKKKKVAYNATYNDGGYLLYTTHITDGAYPPPIVYHSLLLANTFLPPTNPRLQNVPYT